MPPFLDHAPPIAFAHRGGALERPENTMAAFEHAVGLGYSFIETDVRCTADGVSVLLHDPPPPGAAGLDQPVEVIPWAQAQHVRIDGEPLLRTEDAFEAFPRVRFNLDLKTDEAVGPLIEVLRRTGATARVCIGSFSDQRLQRVRDVFGLGVATSMGPREVRRLRAAASRLIPKRAARTRGCCAQVPPTHGRVRVVDAAFVATAHQMGIGVHVWTVNDAAEMHQLLDLGVDGLMTDRVSLLRDVLVERGQWRAP